MLSDLLAGLGIIALFFVIILLICISIVVSVVIAMAVAGYLGVSGLLWWCIVIFVALVIWGILSKL
jgi:hypothetical protein